MSNSNNYGNPYGSPDGGQQQGPNVNNGYNPQYGPSAGPSAGNAGGYGNGSGPGYGPGPQQPFRPVGEETTSRFFRWVRSTYLRRSDDRWIGGVCGGIAERLGWSPALVRVIMLVCALCFGAGGVFYAFAWFLLPDRRNIIIAEDLLAGQWHGAIVGIIILLLFSVGSGALSLFSSSLIAILALWAFLAWGGSQAKRYGWGYGPTGPNGSAGGQYPFDGSGRQGAGPVPPSAGAAWAASPETGAHNGGKESRQESHCPTDTWEQPPVSASEQDSTYTQPAAAGESRNYAQSAPYASAAPRSPYAEPVQPAMAAPALRVRKLRRKPAGPAFVLLSLGLVVLSAVIVGNLGFNSDLSASYTVQVGMIWIGALTLVLGILIMILGTMGRRAGGLIPVAIITLMVMAVVVLGSVASGWNRNELRQEIKSYEVVTLGKNEKLNLDSRPEQIQRYQSGIYFSGSTSAPAKVSIDLSNYQADNGLHKVWLDDASQQDSGCPTGQMRIASSGADVDLQLPKGCSYEVFKQYAVGSLPYVEESWSNSGTWKGRLDRWGFDVEYHNGTSLVSVGSADHRLHSPELTVKYTCGNNARLTVHRNGSATLPEDGQNKPLSRHNNERHDYDDEDGNGYDD